MVDGVLFGSTALSQVFAIDAGTGRVRWLYDPGSYGPGMQIGVVAPKHRGVTYWRDGEDERIFIATVDAFLIALDAKTGKPVQTFGQRGRVNLLKGLRYPKPILRHRDYVQTSPVALFGDTLIVGGTVFDRPKTKQDIPGDVRGFDARSGELRWVFHTVPAQGEFGTESWEGESWRYSGAANAWAPLSVDPDLGFVYVQTSTPTNDNYGGHRLGDNLFAETLLCLDAQTGKRVWHQQLIRHGLWDYDVAAPPNLVDIKVNGRAIRAVAQVTKQGFTFVFDRLTGNPVWPIEERAVPASDVPGERTAATQPFPTRPPPFERQGIEASNLIDFTPDLRKAALDRVSHYRIGPLFTPPSVGGTLILPGSSGGANWTGAGFDPESGMLFVPSITQLTRIHVRESVEMEFDYATGLVAPLMLDSGLPLVKPPYSRITAIDLHTGEIGWQVPIGDGPRNHPLLAGLDLPPLGNGVRNCVLVTKTLLFSAGASGWGIGHDPFLRAFDKRTGALLGEFELPEATRGCPMTYMHGGRQYIAIAVAGDATKPRIVALALKDVEASQ
jgi:quinoprotein glucose dehydrogenase